jgi:hypothetical protein
MEIMRIFLILFLLNTARYLYGQVEVWSKLELSFTSSESYPNPLYDLKTFFCTFTSPTGITQNINCFWDGGTIFKIRFAPTEIGQWTYHTTCSDEQNKGLHAQEGTFDCIENTSSHEIYQRGSIKRQVGRYHLSYADGTPFFYVACTAWNGALKSTEEEWDKYLTQRKSNHYNVIQFVTTQWRGCEKDSHGEVAFTGSGRIQLNPDFFKRLDSKIDEINEHGLVAAPVLLWALPKGQGREHSPGYYLPDAEAILLARYMVARFGGHQVIWIRQRRF